jgi:hypothetical protein
MTTLLVPDLPTQAAPAPAATSARQPRPGATVRAIARRGWEAVIVTSTIAWLTLRLTALVLARVTAWFAAEPRRVQVAAAGLSCAAAVGALLGYAVGTALAHGWATVSSMVLATMH